MIGQTFYLRACVCFTPANIYPEGKTKGPMCLSQGLVGGGGLYMGEAFSFVNGLSPR